MSTQAPPSPLVTCDQCKKTFNQQLNKFMDSRDGIMTVGLQCPYCRARYVAFRTNPRIRSLQARVRKEIEKFRQKITAGVAPNRAERKLKRARKELEKAFTAFNKGAE